MIFEANLDTIYWAEAASTASYLVNRSPSGGAIEKTPEEILEQEDAGSVKFTCLWMHSYGSRSKGKANQV